MIRRLVYGAIAGFCVTVAIHATAQGPTRTAPAHDPSITEGLECSACHTPEGWRVSGAVSGDGGFDHARTGFPLTGRHRTVACTTCHTPGRRVSRECASCHRDEHEGRLGTDCDSCHTGGGWDRMDAISIHRRTRLPLTGMHVLADCTDCHRTQEERAYSRVAAECYACHEADYRRPGVHPNHLGGATTPPFDRDCGTCHRTIAWSPAFVDPAGFASPLLAPAGHEVRFPIRSGVHRSAECESCHADLETPRAVRCTGCHAHGPARLRLQHRPGLVTGDGGACLSCHPGGSAR